MAKWNVVFLSLIVLMESTNSSDERCDFLCHGDCIADEFVCDGHFDCLDKSDEHDCYDDCPDGLFRCDNVYCLDIGYQCDGLDDCGDYSDETNCSSSEDNLNFTTVQLQENATVDVKCKSHEQICQDGASCIYKKYFCDGQQDCKDNSDEINCDPKNLTCWQRPYAFLCDGNKVCLTSDLVCDGHVHCTDGTDEFNNCSAICKEMPCEQECGIVSGVIQCYCHEGFQIDSSNTSSCTDIDECNLPDDQRACGQLCHNSYGSFSCSCLAGYEKTSDRMCTAKGNDPVLIYAASDRISAFNLRKHSHDKLIEHLHGVISLEVDTATSKIFWLEVRANHQPAVYFLDMSQPFRNKRPLITFGLHQPHSLAFDYFGKNLYITDMGRPAILACKPELSACVTVFDERSVHHPTDIALYPQEGCMYWIDSLEHQIARGSMDGKTSSVFLSVNLHRPASLHIDTTSQKLYWIDGFYNRIESANLDGTNRITLVGHQLLHAPLLSVFENSVYWANKGSHAIMAADKFTGHDDQTVLQEIALPSAIVISHSSLQLDNGESNKCKLRHCSHFCLLGLNKTFHCACRDGFQLSSDSKNCTRVKSAVLLVAHRSEILKVPLGSTGVLELSSLKTDSMRYISNLVYLAESDEILYTDLTKDGRKTINLLTNISTEPKSLVVVLDAGDVDSLVVDESSSVVYWINRNTHQVHLSSINGLRRLTLDIDHVEQPHAIAVVPSLGLLFATDLSQPSVVVSCHQDGTSCTTLVTGSTSAPDLLHFHGGMIYLCDGKSISSMDISGAHRKRHSVTHSAPKSLVVYKKQLFWTEQNSDFVHCHSLEKHSLSLCRVEMDKFNLTSLVVAVNNVVANTSCSVDNGGCEHVCVPVPNNVSCLCSDGFILQSDLKSCIEHKEHPSSCDGFLCHNNLSCVHVTSLCDKLLDCSDGSDELKCPEPVTCEGQGFRCKSGRCISQKLFCDGEDDCGDNSDEEGRMCPAHVCHKNEHKCSSNRCIPASAMCDGNKDCHDGSDEASCSTLPTHCKLACSLSCVSADALCDGYLDCVNGEDEKNCSQSPCTTDQYQCQDGECMDKAAVCDGTKHCAMGEDEIGCEVNETVSASHLECNEFKCKNGDCIEKRKACDGITHCSDGSDENSCAVTCKNFNPCSQVCRDSPNGPTCSCREGFKLVGKTLCEDVDECSVQNGGCSQKCLNKKGFHQCWCVAGYTLGIDQRGCKANGTRPYLIVGTNLGIRNVSLTSRKNQLVIATDSAPKHVDFNVHTSEFYWTEYGKFRNMILTSSKGSRWETQADINGIVIDWVTSNVYITEVFNKEGRIKVYDGKKYHKTLIAQENFVPKDIVLHPKTSMMFWLSFTGVHKLERSWMDGLQREVVSLLSAKGSRPMALTIDHPTERLYWLYADSGVIETCKLDGTQKFSLTYHLTQTINSMDVFEGLAYLTDGKDGSVVRINTYEPRRYEPMVRTTSRLGPIKVVHRIKQLTRSNPCKDKSCKFLCVLIPYGGKCLCYDGFQGLTNTGCEEPNQEQSNLHKSCSLHCQNAGLCIVLVNSEICSCPAGYSGTLCETEVKQTRADDGSSKSWLAGLVTLIVVILIVIGVVLFVRYRRKARYLVNTIKFTDPKFSLGKSEDEESLVYEVSFSETSQLDEACKDDPNKDPQWWTRFIKQESTDTLDKNIVMTDAQERRDAQERPDAQKRQST